MFIFAVFVLLIIARSNCKDDVAIFKLSVGTFNVNGKLPPDDPKALLEWIQINPAAPPDLIVIGLQELVSLDDKMNYLNNKEVKRREQIWTNKLLESFDRKYFFVKSKTMLGIYLAMFHRKDSSLRLSSEIFSGTMATGLFDIMPNKGGVGISLRVNNASFCFINSHLTAGTKLENYDKRNEDFHKILQMKFGNHKTVLEHDFVVWLGDLNYRLDIPNNKMSREEIITMIDSDYNELFDQYDELAKAQNAEAAFVDFEEMRPIKFKPTYKYEPGTDDWHSNLSKMPAWCDRILYSVSAVGKRKMIVFPMKYSSANNPKISDHKPVFAEFIGMLKKPVFNVEIRKKLKLRQNVLKKSGNVSRAESIPLSYHRKLSSQQRKNTSNSSYRKKFFNSGYAFEECVYKC